MGSLAFTLAIAPLQVFCSTLILTVLIFREIFDHLTDVLFIQRWLHHVWFAAWYRLQNIKLFRSQLIEL